MAVIFTEGFEAYTVGDTQADINSFSNVWGIGSPHTRIIGTPVQSGARAVHSISGASAMQIQVHAAATAPPHGSTEFWSQAADNAQPADAEAGIGHQVALASDPTHFFGFSEGGGSDGDRSLQFFATYHEFGGPLVVVPNVYQRNTPQHFRMVWRMSSVNADGSDVLADGCCQVWVDGVLVVNLMSLRLALANTGWVDETSVNQWDTCYWALPFEGFLDDIVVTDDAHTCGSVGNTPPVPPNPCCGEEPPFPGGPNPGIPPNAPPPLQPWTQECEGGGTVPNVADLTDPESWNL